MFELIVFFTSFKYIFVEGGEQALVGIGILKKIGVRDTLKITLLGFSVGIVLYFIFLNIAGFIPRNILQIALGSGLLFFSFTMFKEVLEKEKEHEHHNKTKYRIGYFYIAMLEAVENSVALATFSLIEMTSALLGAITAVLLIIGLFWIGITKKIPIRLTRLIAGILLASTGVSLIIYGFGIPTPEFLHWFIPPLS